MEKDLLKLINQDNEIREAVVYDYKIPEAMPIYEHYPLSKEIWDIIKATGVDRLYKHQVEALKLLDGRSNIIVSTGTSSGKTLIYEIELLKEYLNNSSFSALYISPLKALAQDQLRRLKKIFDPVGLSIAIYDGDTPDSQRRIIRARPPNLILTNPDMLHRAILPSHHTWKEFLRDLRYVILDEVHTYRGIFGSHVHQVLKRLKRVASFYGSSARFILLSATIGNPKEFGSSLLDEDIQEVSDSFSYRAAQQFLFLNPKDAPGLFAAKVFCHLVRNRIRTIAFTKSRVLTELLYLWAQGMLGPLRDKIRPYRSGFLPSQRRQIEKGLTTGQLIGVISTSALELGIDIGLLQACLLVGYPGTMMNMWQRSGRVGRSKNESIVILIAKEDALDQYFMKHPKEFFERGVEAAVLDRNNPYILEDHLMCAAAELPLTDRDKTYWGDIFRETANKLLKKGMLIKQEDPETWYSKSKNPQRYVDIRSTGDSFTIFDSDTGEAIGTIDGIRAFKECHPGAVYLHLGRRYQIKDINIQKRDIVASQIQLNYFTKIRTEKDTKILRVKDSRPYKLFEAGLGDLKVTEVIMGYEKRSFPGQVLLGISPLDLPPLIFETVGIWIRLDPLIRTQIERESLHFMGGIHAIEHAMIGMFPLFALCDRNDLGGISITEHEDLNAPGVFLYDGYPGGIGLAEKAYQVLPSLLQRTYQQIEGCECESGCPSCIHSPKCGSGNRPLDKAAALMILEFLLGKRPLEAKEKVGARSPSKPKPQGKVLFFDLETQHSSDEVGGWQNAHLMRLAVACVYDLEENQVNFFREEEVDQLIRTLFKADLVVGYNIKDFDYKVLSPYTDLNLKNIPTLDLLQEIKKATGKRVSLSAVAQGTLKKDKLGNGLEAISWYRQGEFQKLMEYCKMDVMLTKDIYLYGLKTNEITIYDNKTKLETKVSVYW